MKEFFISLLIGFGLTISAIALADEDPLPPAWPNCCTVGTPPTNICDLASNLTHCYARCDTYCDQGPERNKCKQACDWKWA